MQERPSSAVENSAATERAARPCAGAGTDETTFDVAHEEGGIKPAKAMPPTIKQAVQDNTRLLLRTGEEETPTLLYRDSVGHWQIMHCLPDHGFAPILAKMKE